MKRNKVIAIISLSGAILFGAAAIYIKFTNPPITDNHINKYLEAKNAYIKGDLDSSIKITSLLKRKSSNFFQAQLLLGKSLYLSDRYNEADKVFNKLTEKYPQYLEAGLWKARTEIQLDQFDTAYDRVKNLLTFNSDDPRLLGLMGSIEEQKGELGRAIDFYQRASLYEEELAKNRLSLGKLYFRMGVYDKSYAQLMETKELLEKDSPLYSSLEKIISEVKQNISNK